MRTIRIASLAAACLLFAVPALAGDPILDLFKNAKFKLEQNPADPDALVQVRPLFQQIDSALTLKNPTYKEQVTALVDVMKAAATDKPEDAKVLHNCYETYWIRYSLYHDVTDAKAANEQLDAAAKASEKDSNMAARCLYEQARLILSLSADDAKTVIGDETPADAAAAKLTAAKTRAVNKGYYAAHAALDLSEIYFDQKKYDDAKNMARVAMAIDETKGFVTNGAYDCIGRVLIEESNLDGATVMLDAAMKVAQDSDIQAAGYNTKLAWALIEKDRPAEAVAYLKKVVEVSKEKNYRLPPFTLYALGMGYSKQGDSQQALVNLTEYLKSNDLNDARKQAAKKLAAELAVQISKKH